MNYIKILEPRWSTNDILVADHKIGSTNQIVVNHHEHPEPYYASGHELRKYPTQDVWSNKYQSYYTMRVVPIKDLSTDLVLDTL